MSKKKRILYSIVTGVLLAPAWFTWGSGLILLIALVPLLLVEDDLHKVNGKARGRYWLPALSFLIFNILTTWWVKNASFAGLLVALAVNTFMMTTPFWLFTFTRRKMGDRIGYFSLLAYWLAMEYFYLHAEISWTWLNLGNGFANDIRLIQWYEYTGTLGGTLWILLSNLGIFFIIKKLRSGKSYKSILKLRISVAALILVPVLFSIIRFYQYKEEDNPYEIVVVQPNIDPYQKFNDIPVEEQLEIYFRIADSLADDNTDYIVAPETFINNQIWLHTIELNPSIKSLRRFSEKYPKAKQIVGITCYGMYTKEDKSETAQELRENLFYDSFNTGIQIDTTDFIPYYHKSQLVVGVEKMPYTKYLGFLRKIMLNLGGTFRSHGSQDYRDTFISPQDSIRIAPVICYESIFGEYVTEYIREKEGDFIFVITNDGWWGDTPGYKQHNSFSALRAIENRRSVARSANTGISAFFNQKGEILQSLGWWERDGIKATLNANDKLTFYTRNGDYIGRMASVLAIIIIAYTITRVFFPGKSIFREKI